MSIIDAIILGLVQGLTEFIPVSSSGHLILLDKLTAVDSSFSFDVVINIGTLLALIIFFWKKLILLVKEATLPANRKLLRNIVISTVPAVIAGGLWADVFAGDDVRSLNVVVVMLAVVGVLMILADRLLKGELPLSKLKPTGALGVGLAQALALIPGTSRSGATMLAGRAAGLSNHQAAEYSFMIAIPILFGAVARSLLDADTSQLIQNNLGAVVVGVLTAFVSGYLAIRFMLRFLSQKGLAVFGWYRIILALSILLFVS